MSEPNKDFGAFFKTAFGVEPFDYQTRLATDEVMPSLVNVPTGAGKTAAVLAAWLWRRRQSPATVGRRLVYCLPMRTLVDQTRGVAEKAIESLESAHELDAGRFRVQVLMGGDVSNEWDSYPERECILIGTQDMLLSRALNRGYAMSRFRWPVEFGLLNNDCLWVLDEVQLMGSGLQTSTQLQAFRRILGSFGSVQTIWMSATVERDWLNTADFDSAQDAKEGPPLDLSRETSQVIQDVMNAKKIVNQAKPKAGDVEKLAKEVVTSHCTPNKKGHRTLVVVNTVSRAIQLHGAVRAELKKRKSKAEPVLIHSRFRPPDRKDVIDKLLTEPTEAGTIIVSTQVVEAGVDVSAKTLFTELAPWPSLVQRLGRCNRRGKDEDAMIFWIDVKNTDSAPYDEQDMQRARKVLTEFDGKEAGPMALKDFADRLDEKRKKELFRSEHIYVIRQQDVHGLFSTEPDLAGGQTDISMFVRNIERESDAYVYWREFKSAPSRDESPPSRNELCSVRFFELASFLGQKGVAWQWNSDLVGRWEPKRAKEIRPGITLLLANSQGGYDQDLGWTGKASDKPAVIAEPRAARRQEALNDELLSETDYWLSVPDHLRDAEAEARDIVSEFQFSDELWALSGKAVIKADWWHDVGKTLQEWQRAGTKQIEEMIARAGVFLASQPNSDESDFVARFLMKLKKQVSDAERWAKFPNLSEELRRSELSAEANKRIKKAINFPFRPGLRHEAASALAAWQEWQNSVEGWCALAVYLVACHHGKVRTVLRGTKSGEDVFGVEPGDSLPAMAEWLVAEGRLDLRPKAFGAIGEWDESQNLYSVTMPSWIEMVAELLGPELPGDPDPHLAIIDENETRGLGPFRLAFLEALVRAADVRASRKPGKGKKDA
jgi:CRISPR-associated endonuclease/helicase Cas3